MFSSKSWAVQRFVFCRISGSKVRWKFLASVKAGNIMRLILASVRPVRQMWRMGDRAVSWGEPL